MQISTYDNVQMRVAQPRRANSATSPAVLVFAALVCAVIASLLATDLTRPVLRGCATAPASAWEVAARLRAGVCAWSHVRPTPGRAW